LRFSVEAFSHVFSRIEGFASMRKTMAACADIVRVLDIMVACPRSIALTLKSEGGEACAYWEAPHADISEYLSVNAKQLLERSDFADIGQNLFAKVMPGFSSYLLCYLGKVKLGMMAKLLHH
jgi:hypothetical protein